MGDLFKGSTKIQNCSMDGVIFLIGFGRIVNGLEVARWYYVKVLKLRQNKAFGLA